MRAVVLLLISIVLVPATRSFSAEVTIEAGKVTHAITIDGKLEDQGWTEATHLELGNNFTGEPNPIRTEAWLGYDNENILIAFRCEEPDTPIRGKADGDEMAVFAGDTVEIFLDVNQDRKTYWQFVMDPSGLKFDSYVTDSNAGTAWTGKSGIASGHWIAEFKIPFTSLNITPEISSTWTGNLCRGRLPRQGEVHGMFWAYAPVGMFRNPSKFSRITFSELMLERFFLKPALAASERMSSELKTIEKELGEIDSTSGNITRLGKTTRACSNNLFTITQHIKKYKEHGNKPFQQLAELETQVDGLQQQVHLLSMAERLGLEPGTTDFLIGIQDSISPVYSNQPFKGTIDNKITIQMARNEYEGFQLVVLPIARELRELTITPTDLIARGGEKIPRTDIDIRPVHEVIIDNTVGNNRWPDVLGRPEPLNIASNHIQPFLVTVHAHDQLPEGDYTGRLTVRAENTQAIGLNLTVSVWDFALPKETHCHTGMLNISDHSITSHFKVKLFSKEHENVMLDIFNYFADHRIQPGDATPVSWRSRSFLWMGEINPKLKEHFKYRSIAARVDPDYTIREPDAAEEVAYWEKWAGWWRDRGLPVGRIGANLLQLNTVQNHPDYVERSLKAYWKVIESHNWQEYTYVRYPDEIDEPGKGGPETVTTAGAMAKKYAPGLLRQSVQTARTPQAPYLDTVDLWFLYPASYERERALYDRLKSEDTGKVFWLSLHNHIGQSNPAIAPRMLFLILRKYGFTGTGLWTSTWNYGKPKLIDGVFHVDSKNLGNTRSTLIWPAKNGVLFSRRLELVRDGIEDFEYHWLLQRLIEEARGKPNRSATLESALTEAETIYAIDDALVADVLKYSKEPHALLEYRAGIASAIIRLQKELGHE